MSLYKPCINHLQSSSGLLGIGGGLAGTVGLAVMVGLAVTAGPAVTVEVFKRSEI